MEDAEFRGNQIPHQLRVVSIHQGSSSSCWEPWGNRLVGYGREQTCPLGWGELCGGTGLCPGALGEAPTLKRCL